MRSFLGRLSPLTQVGLARALVQVFSLGLLGIVSRQSLFTFWLDLVIVLERVLVAALVVALEQVLE